MLKQEINHICCLIELGVKDKPNMSFIDVLHSTSLGHYVQGKQQTGSAGI